MTKRSRKALIIGAGIAGPVTAILLKQAGFEADDHFGTGWRGTARPRRRVADFSGMRVYSCLQRDDDGGQKLGVRLVVLFRDIEVAQFES